MNTTTTTFFKAFRITVVSILTILFDKLRQKPAKKINEHPDLRNLQSVDVYQPPFFFGLFSAKTGYFVQ